MMKKSIKITKQSNLLALNGAEYKIPYSDGQQYLADDTNIIYEDVGGKRMAITEVRYTDIGNNTIDSLDTNGVNTDWRNFFTIIKSIKPDSPSDIIYNLYYYNVNGERIPISIEGITVENGVLNLSEQAGNGLVWDNDNKKLNININNEDFEFIEGVLTLKEKVSGNNNYKITLDADDWTTTESDNYFYNKWELEGLEIIDIILVDGPPSFFWELGLEAKIIESTIPNQKNYIQFSTPKSSINTQDNESGKPLNNLPLSITVIKAQTTQN